MNGPSRVAISALVALGGAVAPRPASAQNPTEWSTETRTALSFHVADAAVQRLLPAGWTVAPSTAPANRGANLTLTLMERLLVLDGQGKPLRTGTSRYVVLGVPAKNAAGETNTLIVAGLSPEGAGAYGAYQTALVSRVDRSTSGRAEEPGRAQEDWEFAAASGERIELRLSYRRAAAVKGHVDAKVRSAMHPEFTRTYRIDQASDVLRSAATPDRVDSLSFLATGPGLVRLFDGTETLLSVTSIPWYVREISLP